MLFKPVHVARILNGTKTATRRIWSRNHAKVGGTYRVKTKMLSKEFHAKIYVTKIYSQQLKNMTEEDAQKEGGYTLEEFKDVWKHIHGFWNGDMYVTVIEFELVNG